MTKKLKKLLSVVLAVSMAMSLLNVTAFADDEHDNQAAIQSNNSAKLSYYNSDKVAGSEETATLLTEFLSYDAMAIDEEADVPQTSEPIIKSVEIFNCSSGNAVPATAENPQEGYSWHSLDTSIVYLYRNNICSKNPMFIGKTTQVYYGPDNDINNATEIYNVTIVPTEITMSLIIDDADNAKTVSSAYPVLNNTGFNPSKYSDYEYISTDPAVATVDPTNGTVTPISKGTTDVKVVAKEGTENAGTVYFICHVTVQTALESGLPIYVKQSGTGYKKDENGNNVPNANEFHESGIDKLVAPADSNSYNHSAPIGMTSYEAATSSPYTVPKATSDDMTEEEKTDSTTEPYVYERNSNGDAVRKWTCKSVYVYFYKGLTSTGMFGSGSTNLTGKYTGLDSKQAHTYDIPDGTRYIYVQYYWEPEEVTTHAVAYNFNVGEDAGQIPENVTIYGVDDNYLGTPHAYFDGFTANNVKAENNYTIVAQEIENLDFTITPRGAGSNDYIDYLGRTGEEGNYTYYLLDGWKAADGTVYQQGETIIMGSENIELTAQWSILTQEDLDEYRTADLAEGPGLPLTVKYSTGTDALIAQHRTLAEDEAINWSTETADAPLLLKSDRMVYYKATMQMNSETATMLSLGGKISNPEFAHFDITVDLDENLTLVPDEDGNVTFSFACTFLEPSGELYDAEGNEIPVEYKSDKHDKKFTFTVEEAELSGKHEFTIPVDWIPGAYTSTELQSEIVLEVAAARIKEGVETAVKAAGVITGKIDLDKANQNVRRDTVAAGLLASKEWKDYYTGGERELDILDTLRATACLDYAMSNITLTANEVYAKIPADSVYTVVHEYYTSRDGGKTWTKDGFASADMEGEEGQQISVDDIERAPKFGDSVYTYKSVDRTGTVTLVKDLEKNVITFRYERVVNTVTVNYYDKSTGEKIADSYTVEIPQGASYDMTEKDAVSISGYEYDSTTGDALTGTVDSDKVIDVYYSRQSNGGGGGGGGSSTTSVTVKKVWKLDDGGTAADSVTVQLLRNGDVYKTVVLNADNKWTHTWTGLSAGATWTVQEADVPDGFASEVTKKGTTFTITNDDDPAAPPVIDEPDEKEPAVDEPVIDEPVIDEPVIDTPVADPAGPAEPDAPVADVPATGDLSMVWVAAALFSAAGLILLSTFGTKRKDEEA